MNNFRNDLYELADLVERIVGKSPSAIRFWMNKPIEGIGTPRDLVESCDILELIQYLKDSLNEKMH